MIKWFRYQMAMYYLRKARKVSVNSGRLWMYYMAKSTSWIEKVRP